MSLKRLLREVRACRVCEGELPFGPRPVVQLANTARLLIVGQAPGSKVHQSGIPWNDTSGDRLRDWLKLDRATFYDAARVAILPIGFYYPGAGKNGSDNPPRPECAPLWHQRLLKHLPELKLTLLVGQHAHRYYLGAVGITSEQVVQELLADPDSQWHEYRSRGPITKNQFAALLKDFEIRPIVVHPTKQADLSRHGYRAAQFEDAFARFLPPEPNIPTLNRGPAKRRESVRMFG